LITSSSVSESLKTPIGTTSNETRDSGSSSIRISSSSSSSSSSSTSSAPSPQVTGIDSSDQRIDPAVINLGMGSDTEEPVEGEPLEGETGSTSNGEGAL